MQAAEWDVQAAEPEVQAGWDMQAAESQMLVVEAEIEFVILRALQCHL